MEIEISYCNSIDFATVSLAEKKVEYSFCAEWYREKHYCSGDAVQFAWAGSLFGRITSF